MRRLLLSAAILVLCAGHLPAQSEDKEAPNADEKRLKDAYQKTDDASIVEFLSTRARGEATRKVLDKLIEDLDSKDAAQRHKACQQLVAIGAPAVPLLRLTARDGKGTAAELAKKVLKVINDEPSNVTGAAVRLLAERRPAGTAEVLIEYLPLVENDSVMEDVKAALAAVAHVNGKPNPALVKALSDSKLLVRSLAVTALCAGGIAEPRAALRKLLTDESLTVRFRAALGLGQANDAKAVSTLIATLGDLPGAQGSEAEAFLVELAGEQAPKVALGNDDASRRKARDAWAKWWLESDGPALLKELQKRTLSDEALTKATALIQNLGAKTFEERSEAESDLKKMGPAIRPLLKAATNNKDKEISNRAAKVLAGLGPDSSKPLASTVPRVLALRKPKGVAEALLAYVPFAEDESHRQDIQNALNAVTFTNGKANAAVVKALDEKVPGRRAAAAAALGSGPSTDYLADLRKRLDPKTEKDAEVRLKVALALATRGEKEAVPALIRLVAELPAEEALEVDDSLFRLARDNPPKNLPGEDKMKERSAAWQKWWDANSRNVVVSDAFKPEFRPAYRGYVLLIQPKNDQIVELDKNNKVTMTLTGLNGPWDAQWIGDRRLLVTEYNGKRVTERDLNGKIVWEMKLDFYPTQAERLRNGDTFIVGENKIIQVNRAKRTVLTIERKDDLRTARRLPNGQIILITSESRYVRLSPAGRELRSGSLPRVIGYQNEILDNGNVLIPFSWVNEIMEAKKSGVTTLTTTVKEPIHAVRLSNNHLLVASERWPYRFVELDKDGKKVREHVTNVYTFRIRAR